MNPALSDIVPALSAVAHASLQRLTALLPDAGGRLKPVIDAA
jgi:hypothetical protein